MQRTRLEPMWSSTSLVCKSVRGHPSCGERRTTVACEQWRPWAMDSAPTGAVPDCRQRPWPIRTTAGGGRPSVGGRPNTSGAYAGTRSGHTSAGTATQWVKLSHPSSASGSSVALGSQTAEYGLPNPVFNRTPCGSPRMALISFWAKRGLPQGAG